MEEPGGLQSVGLQRVGQDSSDLARSMHTELELELSHCISSSTQYGPAHLHVPPPLHHWLSREAGNSWWAGDRAGVGLGWRVITLQAIDTTGHQGCSGCGEGEAEGAGPRKWT